MNAICDACRPAVEAMWHTMLARDPLCLCVRVCLHRNSPPPLVHVGSSFHSMFRLGACLPRLTARVLRWSEACSLVGM